MLADGPLVVKLGVDLPLSGIDGASAIPVRNAIVLAVDEANRRGFPGGARVSPSTISTIACRASTIRPKARKISGRSQPTMPSSACSDR